MERTSEVYQTVMKRRSCRRFLPDPIPEAHFEMLVQALRWAPSAGNRQPWHFYVVKNPEIKNRLVAAAYGQTFLAEAPMVFVICAIPEVSAMRYGSRGRELYVYQDTAAAVENLLLTATSLDYGTCWVGAFNEKAVSKVLQLPEAYRPVAMIPVGKPAEKPDAPQRRKVEEILTVLE